MIAKPPNSATAGASCSSLQRRPCRSSSAPRRPPAPSNNTARGGARAPSAAAPSAAAANARAHARRAAAAPPTRSVAAAAGGVDLSAFGLEVPDLGDEVRGHQETLGAVFDAADVPVSFNNTGKVLEALTDGAALVDRSHWGRLRFTGADRLSFLHNQSTNAFNDARPGTGRDTVLVTSTARCLDLATALVFESSVMLIVSPSMREALLKRFDKYIFPADDVAVADVTPRTRMFTVAGPKAGEVLRELGGDAVTVAAGGAPYGSHQLLAFAAGRAPVVVAATSGLALPGFTLIADEAAAGDLYAALINRGCVPCGEEDWERARVTQGRPAAGAELTEDYNPFEAGLYHCTSVTKGCYIGQETLAKLNNTGGVKQQLWGLQLKDRAAPGAHVTRPAAAAAATADGSGDATPAAGGAASSGGDRLGVVTSVVNLLDSGHFALAYLRCRSGGATVDLNGATVDVGGVPARVVPIPFASRGFEGAEAAATAASPEQQQQQQQQQQSGAGAEASSVLAERAAQAKREKAEKAAAEAAARAERLAAMQARLAAWQESQASGGGGGGGGQ